VEAEDEAGERRPDRDRALDPPQDGTEPQGLVALDAPEPVAGDGGQEAEQQAGGGAGQRAVVTPTR